MLLKLSDKISQCLAHAADARERADAATDPSRRADLLDMELSWLRLVESYRFLEQASRFLEDSRLARIPSPKIADWGAGHHMPDHRQRFVNRHSN